MSESLLPRDLMEKLARVDSKLEKLLAHQTLPQDEDLAGTQPAPGEKFSEDILVADSEDEKIQTVAGFSDRSENPRSFRVAVSKQEADSIFQKVDNINRDVEVMWRVERLERQNRKIVILGSMFITLVILMIGVSTFLMFQANLLNQGIFLKTGQRVSPPQPSSGEAAAKETPPQPPKPIAEVQNTLSAAPKIKVNDPQPVAAPSDPKTAEVPAPVKYVGFLTSNKYHYPGCKWAAGIKQHGYQTFSSDREAREKGYIPCPTCKPSQSD
jgi:hypothetical protein